MYKFSVYIVLSFIVLSQPSFGRNLMKLDKKYNLRWNLILNKENAIQLLLRLREKYMADLHLYFWNFWNSVLRI